MKQQRKFLHTDFIKFILEKYSDEGQGLPDDEEENENPEKRKSNSIKRLNEFDDEEGQEEPQSDDEVDDEIITELLNQYKRLKKKYENHKFRNRRK